MASSESSGMTTTPDVDLSDQTINTEALEALQTDEQRHVLDTIAQLRKCGLERMLSLPQLVVCGDQSSGKSSVLEALTEIPFPRNDNLCTRFPTEIILRRALVDSLTIRLIPGPERTQEEQDKINDFNETITDFNELPAVMGRATNIMGIDKVDSTTPPHAFARDTLSILIEGPERPQLTLVDLPGIIQNETTEASMEDVRLVSEITEHYISQSRTICLAVVSATNDYANQPILTKVRSFDPQGERTLGIITKPDRLSSGSGTESAFIRLARNEDVFFKLGWHVLKNRKFEEATFSSLERNASEAQFFRTSNFKELPASSLGISSLTSRLSQLLFAHVYQELPKLQEDLETALGIAKEELAAMGVCRANPRGCREFLIQLSLDYYEICKAAIGGHYDGDYLKVNISQKNPNQVSSRRLRASIQRMNAEFSDNHRLNGNKFKIEWFEPKDGDIENEKGSDRTEESVTSGEILSYKQAIDWASEALSRAQGRELAGNFNPLVVSELFWEQSSKWKGLAMTHIERVAEACHQFVANLLKEKGAGDVYTRLWPQIRSALKSRQEAAEKELEQIMTDINDYPINYNHYYTDLVTNRRRMRGKPELAECIDAATSHQVQSCNHRHAIQTVDAEKAATLFAQRADPNMRKHACEDVLDCLYAIYKVSQKVFVANITTQVIERHLVRGLEGILSPTVVGNMSDSEVEALVSESSSAKRQRAFLSDKVAKLEDGKAILREVMSPYSRAGASGI
ncbi:hypothetical protein FQN57_005420 [Myotisia sp. PD_48]|nr:hypothetical protein FQN57_005420 [Myotisia sp. PD_48]